MSRSELLLVDGIGNVGLGAILIIAPLRLSSWLGLPEPTSGIFPSLFGAVLVGIGIALLMQRRGTSREALGLTGALVINSCFGVALFGWLLAGGLELPVHGALILWTLAVILIVLSAIEMASTRR